ncbi:TonB-dependent receptor [Novosphingobium sp.]|uniref:TonB-dependent receptor n=1 Tax=Novosphingobium sp. TaxID=1874826 RepID=UPI0035B09FAB
MTLRTKISSGLGVSVLALAVSAVALPTIAQAQDAAAGNQDDAIVVTGFRGSLDSSAAQKKASSSIVEVIAPEDLGKLPDLSIAESLSRLPGLATQRLDGRANVVSIRGLAPDFTTTLLNGREQVSAGNNRGVELDQYPTELLNGAVVYKTPDAKLIGQALGGTVDMKTVRPLAYGKRQVVVGLRGELNDLNKLNPDVSNKGYRANVFYVDQNDDETIGWAIGYARMQSPTQEERWNAWGYPDLNASTKVIGGAKPYVKSNELKRDGLMGVLEFKSDDAFHTTFDGYWSKFKDDQRLRGIELPLQWSGAQLQPGYSSSDGLVTAGTYKGVEAVMRNDVVHRDAEIWAIGNNTQFQANDTLTFDLDLSYSKLKKTEENLEIYLGTGRGGGVGATDTLGFTMPASGGVISFKPTINYADPALFTITDPQGWNSCGGAVPNCQDGFVNRPTIKDRLQSIRLQAVQALDGGLIDSITVGANYSDRRKQLIDEGFVLTNKNYPASPAVPSSYLFQPTSLDFIGIPGMVSFDSWKYYNDGNYKLTSEALWTPGRLTNSYVVREKVLTGFVQASINSGGLKGNVGVQVVHTNQQADGFAATNPGTGTISKPITDGAKYTDFLPSLNLSYEVAPQTLVRFGAARMLARARMDQLNPGVGYSFNAANNVAGASITRSPWSGTVGNAKLRPLMADTVDMAVEKYFGRGAYVSVGGFYKHLENWIYRQDSTFDFTGTPTPGNVTPTFNQGLVSQWQNGKSGKVYGFEGSLSLPFSTFSTALDGFGFLASASYTDSKVTEGGAKPISMPGLSRWVVNGTVFYEKNGFQARASGRYRSKFLAEVSGLSLARDRVMAAQEFVVDAQVGYTFQSGSLEGLGVLLQVSNLTNERFLTYYNDDVRQVRDYQNYGRNFMLGVTYKF